METWPEPTNLEACTVSCMSCARARARLRLGIRGRAEEVGARVRVGAKRNGHLLGRGGVPPLDLVDDGTLVALRPALLALLLPQPPRRLERRLAQLLALLAPRRSGGRDPRCTLLVRRARARLPLPHLPPHLLRRLSTR